MAPSLYYQGGVELTISDVDVPPATSVWAKLKKTISGFGDVSVRGDMDASAPESIDLDVRANAFGTSVQLLGQAGEFYYVWFRVREQSFRMVDVCRPITISESPFGKFEVLACRR